MYRSRTGFVPNHIEALRPLPRLIVAEDAIANALLDGEHALSRRQKELLLLTVSAASNCRYATALHLESLRLHGVPLERLQAICQNYRQADLAAADVALLDFAMILGSRPAFVDPAEIETLRRNGFSDVQILEAILAISWGGYLCTLSSGLGVQRDFSGLPMPAASTHAPAFRNTLSETTRRPADPHIREAVGFPEEFPPFERIREKWGFIPNLFRVQTIRPDLVRAEIYALDLWLNTSDVLTRRRKELIYLAVSAANLNVYCVAAHCEVLRGLGVPVESSDQIAIDHHLADIPQAEKALLDVCLKLARQPHLYGPADRAVLEEHGFTRTQALEAIVVTAVTNFVNTLTTGLGVTPDFEPRTQRNAPGPHPFAPSTDHTDAAPAEAVMDETEQDADAVCVERVKSGDTEAFEELVRRHGRRVHRTLSGILRQDAEIEDAVQDTFVKAFQNIARFEGRSRFSTWLTRIAINTGLQRLRGRREFESLDDGAGELDEFRPRQVQAWQDDPEQSFSKSEMRDLLRNALSQLPPKYRVVVILRDLQQLSTKETAAAMGLGVPAVKARLLRGRLMLREALCPHFVKQETARIHG